MRLQGPRPSRGREVDQLSGKLRTEVRVRHYMHFGGKCHRVGENGEFRMMTIRRGILAVGAVAFLSSQAAYAAPVQSPVDPLVSLSVLAGGPSSAAVCAGSVAATAAAATAAVQGAPGCVLPVTTPPPPAVAQTAPPPPMVQAGSPKTIGTLPISLGLAAIIAVAALLLSNNGNGHGNPTPVSPADWGRDWIRARSWPEPVGKTAQAIERCSQTSIHSGRWR